MIRRAEVAVRAGTLIKVRRTVAVVALVKVPPPMVAAARVRLKAMHAHTNHAALAVNFPDVAFAQNQIWVAVVQLATELTAWLQILALTGTGARRWEPKRIRLHLFSAAGTIARRSRRVWLHLSGHAPHRHLFTAGLTRLNALPHPT